MKGKFRVTFVLLLIFTLLFLTACASDTSGDSVAGETVEEMAALVSIQERGYFTYGLEAQYRPFEYRDENDEIVGFDIDLADEIAKRMGVEARPVDTSWGAVIQTLYDGGFDFILGGMTATEARYERVNFSIPYMDAGSGLLVRKDAGIKGKADLDGKIVGAGEGTPSVWQLEVTAEELDIQYKEDIKTFDDDAGAYESLKVNRLDAYASSFNSLNEFAKENPEFEVIDFKSEMWSAEYSVMAFRKEDVGLRAIVNGILIEMKEDGTLQALQEKWFDTSFELPNIPPVW